MHTPGPPSHHCLEPKCDPRKGPLQGLTVKAAMGLLAPKDSGCPEFPGDPWALCCPEAS